MFWFSNTDPSVALLIRVYLFTSALAALVPILGIIGYIRQSKPIISIGMLALFVSVGPLAQYVAAGVQTLHLAGARQIAGFAGNILQIAGLVRIHMNVFVIVASAIDTSTTMFKRATTHFFFAVGSSG